jgi:hypothetical protein
VSSREKAQGFTYRVHGNNSPITLETQEKEGEGNLLHLYAGSNVFSIVGFLKAGFPRE